MKFQELESQGCHEEEEEKEQLSPVSVMDFPYQDEEEEEEEEIDDDEINEPTSSCFPQNFANIERTTHQLLQKIRRFESLADLEPVDLAHRYATFEEEEEEGSESSDHVALSDGDQTDEITAWDLIRRLKTRRQVGPHEKLLVDFFLEGLSWSKSAPAPSDEVEALLSAADDWMDGGGYLEAEEHGVDQLKLMERNGRWRSFEEGKDDVAADVELRILGSLLQELVLDLFN